MITTIGMTPDTTNNLLKCFGRGFVFLDLETS